jgi:hypothetical protein
MRRKLLKRFDRAERAGHSAAHVGTIHRAHVRKHALIVKDHESSHGAVPKHMALAHRTELPRVAQNRPDPASARLRCSLPAALLALLLFPRIRLS